jgi:hypothetical protein
VLPARERERLPVRRKAGRVIEVGAGKQRGDGLRVRVEDAERRLNFRGFGVCMVFEDGDEDMRVVRMRVKVGVAPDPALWR